ncbi:hypothetical protein CRENBAI_025774, partial [Crenichthys baileyi]
SGRGGVFLHTPVLDSADEFSCDPFLGGLFSDTGHLVESGTHLLLELNDSWIWIHSPGNSHPKINKPPSCHSHSPSRTWNTNLPRRRNHLPPGYPVPPPPSFPPSQEPERMTVTFSSSFSTILLWITQVTSSYSLTGRIDFHPL